MNQITVEKTEKYLILKIPLRSVSVDKEEISSKSKKVIGKAISEGLADIKAGRVFGPFKNIREFKSALKKNA